MVARFAMYMYVEYYAKSVTFVVSSVFLYVKFNFFFFASSGLIVVSISFMLH